VGDRARVLRNVVPNRGHWLKLKIVEQTGKRDALGAEVSVRAGGQRLLRVVRTADSYLSASDGVAHFGLGKADSFDEVEVVWPSGRPRRERFAGGKADCLAVLRQGTGTVLAEEKKEP
jgi:hypothetical protein